MKRWKLIICLEDKTWFYDYFEVDSNKTEEEVHFEYTERYKCHNYRMMKIEYLGTVETEVMN